MQNVETVAVEKGLCQVGSVDIMDAHKETRKSVCSEFLEQYENGRDYFPSRIVTGDESWLHNFF